MEVKKRQSEKELRRIFRKRPALKVARELLWKIEAVSYCTRYEDWELELFGESTIITPAVFWEYLAIAGQDGADFEDSLKGGIETFKAILAAMPKEAVQGGPDNDGSGRDQPTLEQQ
ncbi:hypothetical protein [Bradyrhizobium ottawaense]|uniref:hypothetical protein n=1 Tax=Bradyrhizobium ottawaense TaxID=931866 RepID=UPI0034770509